MEEAGEAAGSDPMRLAAGCGPVVERRAHVAALVGEQIRPCSLDLKRMLRELLLGVDVFVAATSATFFKAWAIPNVRCADKDDRPLSANLEERTRKLIAQFFALQRAWGLMEEYESLREERYTHVARVRTDTFFVGASLVELMRGVQPGSVHTSGDKFTYGLRAEMGAVVRLAERLAKDDFRGPLVRGQLTYQPLNWTALAHSEAVVPWHWLLFPAAVMPNVSTMGSAELLAFVRARHRALRAFDAALRSASRQGAAVATTSAYPGVAFIPERAYFLHVLSAGLICRRVTAGKLERTTAPQPCDL